MDAYQYCLDNGELRSSKGGFECFAIPNGDLLTFRPDRLVYLHHRNPNPTHKSASNDDTP